MTEQKELYRRVIVKGKLISRSDLHIGNGDADTYLTAEADELETENYLSNSIVLDQAKKPYIPGSTLRGLLA